MDLQHTPPDSRGDHGVSKSHCCRLEDVSNLRVDSRVVPRAVEVSTVTVCHCIVSESIRQLSWDKSGEPLSVHNVLVGSDSQHTGTIVKPFVLFINTTLFFSEVVFTILIQPLGPEVVYSEPEDAHGEQKRILIPTRVSNS